MIFGPLVVGITLAIANTGSGLGAAEAHHLGAAGPSSSSPPEESFEGQSILFIFFDSSHRVVIQNATDAAITQCMADQGFDFDAVEREVQEPEWTDQLRQRLGPSDESTAQRLGYGLGESTPAFVDEPSGDAAFQQALTGGSPPQTVDLVDPTSGAVIGALDIRSGCLGEADAAVFGSVERRNRYYSLDIGLQNLAVGVLLEAESSSTVLAAQAEWASCMQAQGYDYLTTSDPLDVDWPDPLGDEERTTALADVACKQEVGLVDLYLAEVTALATERQSEHVALLEEWYAIIDEIVTRLDGGP